MVMLLSQRSILHVSKKNKFFKTPQREGKKKTQKNTLQSPIMRHEENEQSLFESKECPISP